MNNAVLNRGWRLFKGDTCYKISENNVVLRVIGIRLMPPHQAAKYHKGWIGEVLQH